MTYISVDVEADGAIPSDYSMISLGAVVVDSTLDKTFYGQLRPISDNYNPQALAVSGFTSFAVKPRTSGRGCKAMIAHKNLINHMSSYRKNAKITP